jgi:hypothetical protein
MNNRTIVLLWGFILSALCGCSQPESPNNSGLTIMEFGRDHDQVSPYTAPRIWAKISNPENERFSVELVYFVNSFEDTVTMEYISDAFYAGIPSQIVETEVKYYIRAWNLNSETRTDTISYTVQYYEFAAYLSPVSDTVSVDGSITLSFKMSEVIALFGASIELIYDTSSISIDSFFVPDGSIWGQHECLFYRVDSDSSVVIAISEVQTDGLDNINGSGTLFGFKVTGRRTGSYNIRLGHIFLIDEWGRENGGLPLLIRNNATIVVR